MSAWAQGTAILLFTTALAPAAGAAENRGGDLVGLVEDTRGLPIAGAVISLFGKGIGSAGLVTFSDSAGRFSLPALPAGSYTLRALEEGHLPAPARQVTVLANRDSVFTVSLTPISESVTTTSATPEPDTAGESARELRWLLRHKRRSVMESETASVDTGEAGEKADPVAVADQGVGANPFLGRRSSWLDLDGTLELIAAPTLEESREDGLPASFSSLRLQGRIAGFGRWSLGGLVGESEGTNWRMAAEFVLEPGGGHQITTGTGYGTRFLRPPAGETAMRFENRGVGAVSFQDRWTMGKRVSATWGGRVTHIGFLEDHNHVDPLVSVEVRSDEQSVVRGTVSAHTLAPGGDLLTVSALSSGSAVAMAVMDARLRPERATRYEVGLDQELGRTTVGAFAFYEGVRDQLVNTFEHPANEQVLRIANGGSMAARGMGMTVSRRLSHCVHGSVTYVYGHSWRDPAAMIFRPREAGASLEGDFHDVSARFETVIDSTDTRLVAFYRMNSLAADTDGSGAAQVHSRFDVQLTQGLPFLGSLTRAEWELLVAFRNLFYEASEGAVLDEIAVANPPKRIVGGISVRF
jgi:Carboxypeptidase regulatory-like domain/TonB dependent receptor